MAHSNDSSPSSPLLLARARVPRTQMKLPRTWRTPSRDRERDSDSDYPLPDAERIARSDPRSQLAGPTRQLAMSSLRDRGYPPPDEARIEHHPSTVVVGANAEELAACYLRSKGYFIIERNFRCKPGEIDIVAFRANPRYADAPPPRNASPAQLVEHRRLVRAARMLVFVEVRSRADAECGDAIEAIGPRKQRQVVRVAHYYLMLRHPTYEEIRFDAVGITAGVPTLIEDAFWP